MDTLKQPWYKGETINTSIGQGYVEATPLQLAVAAARLATGREVKPRIILVKNEYYRYFKLTDNISSHSLRIVQAGMIAVVNEPGGTAGASRIYDKNYAMACKTGSAQVKGINRNIARTKAQEKRETHSIFIGFAPVSKPKFAVGV